MAEENSVACRTQQELATDADPSQRKIYLSSVFLANISRVNPNDPSLSYSLTFGARVPDYKLNQVLWFDQHYEGSYLFRDTLVVEILPPTAPAQLWQVRTRWQSEAAAPTGAGYLPLPWSNGSATLKVPFASTSAPGISGTLIIDITGWN